MLVSCIAVVVQLKLTGAVGVRLEEAKNINTSLAAFGKGVCVYMLVCIHTFVCICLCVYMLVYVYVCVYMHVCLHVCVHT